ncbi:MAG TPA: hypothetical protein VGV89_08045 [Thermoplasmata archaeon]|nr:hypothetical protein [Thermoplasmata archaeon]
MILWLYSVLLRAAAPFQQEPERTELRKMAVELLELEQMRRAHASASR